MFKIYNSFLDNYTPPVIGNKRKTNIIRQWEQHLKWLATWHSITYLIINYKDTKLNVVFTGV